MTVQAKVEDSNGPLPGIVWQWDPETDILSGAFAARDPLGGFHGSIELTDDDGSVAMLDVQAGLVCGLDIVVWPEVDSIESLAPPGVARNGRVIIPARPSRPGTAALEVDTTLAIAANLDQSVFHLRIGVKRPVEPVRVANHLVIEIDQRHRLAGFWLSNVPVFPTPA